MKKICTLITALVVLSLSAKAQWSFVGNPDFSTGEADNTNIAFDPSGTPYVTYQEVQLTGQFAVKKYNGSQWVSVGTSQFVANGNQAYQERIRINSTGTPYVFACDYNYGCVKKFDGTNWVYVGDSQFTLVRPDYIDIALSSTSAPYVAFSDYYGNYRTTVMKFDGTKWDTLGQKYISSGQAYYNSIATDAGGNVYVAFSDYNYSGKATVMKYNGTSWSTLGTAGFTPGQADYVSLALDPSGTPYVAFANGSLINVMKYSGGSWVAVGIVNFENTSGTALSLAIDGSGTPYVAFDGPPYGQGIAMKYDGNSWTYLDAPLFTPDAANYISIAVAPDGVPYVVFNDGSGGSQEATVMSFGHASGISDLSEQSRIKLSPNPAADMIRIDAGSSAPERVTITDLSGQQVMDVKYAQQIDISSLSSGMYFIALKGANASTITCRFTKL